MPGATTNDASRGDAARWGRFWRALMGRVMDELHAFELRRTMPSGAVERIQVTTTQREASALARRYLAQGRAIRVELWTWRRGRYELSGVIDRNAIGSASPGSPR
jgi:hypothetical protein